MQSTKTPVSSPAKKECAVSKLHLDFETRSTADLPEIGARRYSEHPDTGIWCIGFAFDDLPPEVVSPQDRYALFTVIEHVRNGGLVYAHNAAFEWYIWNNVLSRYIENLPKLKPSQLRCTQAMALSMGLPQSLEDVARALKLTEQKDTLGKALMMKYATPWRVDGDRIQWQDECPKFRCGGENWTGTSGLDRLLEYCGQDVVTERAAAKIMNELSPYEQTVWVIDLGINHRGIRIDRPAVEEVLIALEAVAAEADAELSRLTDGEVASVTALTAMRDFLSQYGVETKSLDKAHVDSLLGIPGLPDVVRKVLQVRQDAGKSSNAKYAAMHSKADSNDRLYGAFQYHGAQPGRWAGRGVQLQNLPRGTPDADQVDALIEGLKEARVTGDYGGVSMTSLSEAIRGMFLPDEGCVWAGGDFGQVEGRGTAWISGEDWKLDVFRKADRGEGPGVYEVTAAGILKKKPEEVTKAERQGYGKVPELALGYGGSVGAFQSMAVIYGVDMTDEQVEDVVYDWRRVHRKTVSTWYDLEDSARAAIRSHKTVFSAGAPGRQVHFQRRGPHLFCRLPSGREITYPYVQILKDARKGTITYMKVRDPNLDRSKVIDDESSFGRWQRVTTWGGKLMENVVQAICRDLLADVMVNLRRAKYTINLHVHDEVRCSVPAGKVNRGELTRIFTTVPEWAEGFPLNAEIDVTRRYGK